MIYQVQLDGVAVGQYSTLEDAIKGVNAEIHFGTNPLSLHIQEISDNSPLTAFFNDRIGE